MKNLADMKMFIVGAFFLLSLEGPCQGLNPDSVIAQVFRAISLEKPVIIGDTNVLLRHVEWEALAYWDTTQPRSSEYMEEAVGDLYIFKDSTFVIRLINPQQPRSYLSDITGNYIRKREKITFQSTNGKVLSLYIIFLDNNYLVLETDGLRIFFTKNKSFYTE